MLQDRSHTSQWTETIQGPAEGSLLHQEFDSLGGKSQGWWQSLLRHTEHPLCPGTRDCRAQGELELSVLPCHTSLGLGDNLHTSCGGASAGCPPARGVMPV